MNKINIHIRWILAVLSLLAANAVFAQSVSTIISDQRTRQITRQISDNVTRRVSSDIDATFKSSALQTSSLTNDNNPMAASADGSALLSDASLWDSFSWSRISDDSPNLGATFDVDVFQNTTGIDKKLGDFYFGGSLTYVYANANADFAVGGGKLEINVHAVSITPYAAYVINKNFFLTALTGYTYSTNNPKLSGGPSTSQFINDEVDLTDAESDSYNTELALNGLKVIDSWFMRGKVGARYVHDHTKTDPFTAGDVKRRDNEDSWTYLVDSEGGYSFDSGIRLYTGVLFEYNNPKPSQGFADGVFYYNAGIDYAVTRAFTLGAKASTDLNNEDIDLTTVALTARLAL
jgi:hypothetical protein